MLAAGHQYYIEALQKEGIGGDNLAAGWSIPGGAVSGSSSGGSGGGGGGGGCGLLGLEVLLLLLLRRKR